jgi:S-(hydroxymethyl)glutathione dehydrogenase/alcohol dehydrogenase
LRTRIRAAVLRDVPGQLTLEELGADSPRGTEVAVRPVYVGLCHSDQHYLSGNWATALPTVMGHEAAGVVAAVGEMVTTVKPGDRVVVSPTSPCGLCDYCIVGRSTLCSRRDERRRRAEPVLTDSSGDAVVPFAGLGAFAEIMLVQESATAVLPDSVPLSVGCLLGCCVMTGVGAVIHTAQVQAGSSVAIIGCGGVGMSIIQGARLAGAAVIIAIDLDARKLERAVRFGATHTIDPKAGPLLDAVHTITGRGVDYAFEAVGTKQTAEGAFQLLAPAGVATIVGLVPEGQHVEVPADALFFEEKRLQGSYMGSNNFRIDVGAYTRLYTQGRLLLDEMVSGIITLDEINEGFSAMQSADVTRIVVNMQG